MALAPIEIQKKEFRRSFRGYNEEEVKNFLEKISSDYEKIYKQNQDLKEEITSLQEKIQQYRDMESTLKNAVILAQKTAEDTRRNALKEKEIILREALVKAEKIINRAEQRFVALNGRYEELKMQFNLFKTRFTNFLQSQIEIVNSCELNDIDENKYIFDSSEMVAAGSDEVKKERESDSMHANDLDVSDALNSNDEACAETVDFSEDYRGKYDASSGEEMQENASKDEEPKQKE